MINNCFHSETDIKQAKMRSNVSDKVLNDLRIDFGYFEYQYYKSFISKKSKFYAEIFSMIKRVIVHSYSNVQFIRGAFKFLVVFSLDLGDS